MKTVVELSVLVFFLIHVFIVSAIATPLLPEKHYAQLVDRSVGPFPDDEIASSFAGLNMSDPRVQEKIRDTIIGQRFGWPVVRNDDYLGFWTVTSTSLAASTLSQLANVFMLYRILVTPRWWRSWNHRFPFYLTVSDLLFNLNNHIEFIPIAITQKFAMRTECKLLGGFTQFIILWNMFLVLCAAVTAYIKVYLGRQISFGRLDWKYHVAAISVPIIMAVIGTITDTYGTSTYWCLVNIASLQGKAQMWSMISFVGVSTTVTTYCYLMIIRMIRKSAQAVGSSAGRRRVTSNQGITRKPVAKEGSGGGWFGDAAIRKMSGYILVFILQWIPGSAMYTIIMLGHDTIPVNTVTVFFSNIGGLLNAIIYVQHNGLLTASSTCASDGSDSSPGRRSMVAVRSTQIFDGEDPTPPIELSTPSSRWYRIHSEGDLSLSYDYRETDAA